MKTAHIALIGGQTIPIYNGIRQFPSDKIIFIHSKQSLVQAKVVAKTLATDNIEFKQVDPNDYENIHTILSLLSEKLSDYRFTGNLTGGTKLMSLALYDILSKREDSKLIYIDQNNVCTDLLNNTKSPITVFNKAAVIFNLMGEDITKFNELPDFTFDIPSVIHHIREMQHIAASEFYSLINFMTKSNQHTGCTNKGSEYNWDKQNALFKMSVKTNDNKTLNLSLNFKKAIDIIKYTRWFELEVALLLDKWQMKKELLLGVEVNYEQGYSKNEIDILVNTGTKLIFIECKTQINDIKDLDKFRNVVKNYGGLAAKPFLITDMPLKPHILEKCQDNKIVHFCISEAKKNGKSSVEDQLFALLEQEIKQSNPV